MQSILKDFTVNLLSEDRCRVWFLHLLHGDDIRCPRCGFPLQKPRRARFFAGEISYCSNCKRKYGPLKGTPFHSTKLTFSELTATMFLRELNIPIKMIAFLLNRQSVAVSTAAQKIQETFERQTKDKT